MSATAARGGGTRTQTVRPKKDGCGCKPNAAGQCCATKSCGCAKENKGCGPDCGCGGTRGAAPMCDCNLPRKLCTVTNGGDNQGRKFWGCPQPQANRCEDIAFKWADNTGACANPLTAGGADDDAGGAGPSGGNGMFDPIDLDSDDEGGGGGRGGGKDGGTVGAYSWGCGHNNFWWC